MNGAMFVALPTLAFSAALMFLLPYMSPVRYFFAITVRPEFRSTETAQTIMRRYHRHVLAVAAISLSFTWLVAESFPELAVLLAMLLPMIGGMFCFLRARNDVRHYAASLPQVREAQLSTGPDHLPRWIALALPPFAFPLLTAVYLRAHWDEIPQRFAVHYNLAGEPNRWAAKSTGGVYTPLLIEAGLLLFVLLLSVAIFYGARRGPQRLAVLKMEVATMYFLAWVFTTVALLPVIQFPMGAFLVPTVLFTIGVIVWCIRMARDPGMPVDPTPDQYWHLGSFYFNSDDPALFVQKRVGFGYTFNFANRLSWFLMGFLAVAIVGFVFAVRYK